MHRGDMADAHLVELAHLLRHRVDGTEEADAVRDDVLVHMLLRVQARIDIQVI